MPDAETMMSGSSRSNERSPALAIFSPTTEPIDPPMKAKFMIAAWTGIQLGRWAPLGIGGGPSAPSTVFATAMGASADLSLLTADLGASWGIRDGYHKLFACCQYAHATVEALLGEEMPPEALLAATEEALETLEAAER